MLTMHNVLISCELTVAKLFTGRSDGGMLHRKL
jgi:hypothetical protein